MLELFEGLLVDRSWRLQAATLMPDHVHFVGILGGNNEEAPDTISLGDIVRLFKGRLTPLLRARSVRWQPGGYFDRRLRDSDELSRALRYMLANPYRKGLLPWDARWPYWPCESDTWEWFGPTTDNGRPFREWSREAGPGSLP